MGLTYCRVCGTPPNKYRQAAGMDICRTCDINSHDPQTCPWCEKEIAREIYEALKADRPDQHWYVPPGFYGKDHPTDDA
jgi:hypothetical protein